MTQQEIEKKFFEAKKREFELKNEMLYQIELYREQLRKIDDIYLETSRDLLDLNDFNKGTMVSELHISQQRGTLLAKISNTNAMRSLVDIF